MPQQPAHEPVPPADPSWRPQVVTGEAVALDLRLAALPSRVVAGLVDGVLQLLLAVVLFGLAAAVGASASEAASSALTIVALVGVLIAYTVVFETLLRGRTPGKAAMGLRVVRDDGGPIGFRHAFVRGLAGAFVERPGITFFTAGVVTSLLHPRNKRVGDLLAGTVVLQERVAVRGGPVAEMPPQLEAWAAELDLSGLPPELALAARQFTSRSAQLTPAAREQLGGQLVAAVTAAVRQQPPPGTPGWAVLAAVLAERRRREELRLSGRPSAAAASRSSEPPAAAPPPPAVVRDPPPAAPGGFVAPS
jgi:uncharacterized RDD family membrane protein YckC